MTNLEDLKSTLLQLSASEQNHLAGFLLMERLKRNKPVMLSLHQRIEDSDTKNWQSWEKTREEL